MKVCDCHSVPMRWTKANRPSGGFWSCMVKVKADRDSRRARLKESLELLVELETESRGSQCEWPGCDWFITLHWHHRDPSEKKFPIGARSGGKGIWVSPQVLIAELAKCDLLCPNHHSLADMEGSSP